MSKARPITACRSVRQLSHIFPLQSNSRPNRLPSQPRGVRKSISIERQRPASRERQHLVCPIAGLRNRWDRFFPSPIFPTGLFALTTSAHEGRVRTGLVGHGDNNFLPAQVPARPVHQYLFCVKLEKFPSIWASGSKGFASGGCMIKLLRLFTLSRSSKWFLAVFLSWFVLELKAETQHSSPAETNPAWKGKFV